MPGDLEVGAVKDGRPPAGRHKRLDTLGAAPFIFAVLKVKLRVKHLKVPKK